MERRRSSLYCLCLLTLIMCGFAFSSCQLIDSDFNINDFQNTDLDNTDVSADDSLDEHLNQVEVTVDSGLVFLPEVPVISVNGVLLLATSSAVYDEVQGILIPVSWLYDYMRVTTSSEEQAMYFQGDGVRACPAIYPTDTDLDCPPNTYISLKAVAANLGFVISYEDGIAVLGSSVDDHQNLKENAGQIASELINRWVRVESNWLIKEINESSYTPVMENYRWFWRYLGQDRFSLYQCLANQPDMAFLFTASFVCHSAATYGSGTSQGSIVVSRFLAYPNICYVLIQYGGASMGGSRIWRFASDHEPLLLVEEKIGFFTVSGDYVYFTYTLPFNLGLYRVHIPTILSGRRMEAERVGDTAYIWGYYGMPGDESEYKIMMRESGFSVSDGFLYTNGFSYQLFPEGQGFYRIDLDTMQHELILNKSLGEPQVDGEWIVYLDKSQAVSSFNSYYPLCQIRLDGSDYREIHPAAAGFSVENGEITYWTAFYRPMKSYIKVAIPD